MTSTLEGEIANIWKEILGVQDVAPDDDFFELGGTSLHAARVVTKTRAAFRVKLPTELLLEHPTLATFAAQVSSAQGFKARA